MKFRRAIVIGTSRGCVAALLAAPLPGVARAEPAPSRQSAAVDATSDATPDVENEKALQTFREGIAAFDRRDFEAARVAFLQTFALKPSAPVVRRNLGLAEIYSGHYLEGARRLGRVIHTTDEGSSVDRARMVESLKKAEAHLERVTVEVNTEGAQIEIGGVDLGVSPLPFAWYLEPGAYDVRVSKPGFIAHQETRLARAGNALHLRVNLKPIDEASPGEPAAPPPALPRDDAGGGVNPWIVAAGGTLTAGGLLTGLTLSLLAADNADKVERIRDAIGGVGCRPPVEQACRELSDAAGSHDSQRRWATVSYALGAAAGVSTLVYVLVASASSSGKPAASASDGISVGVGGQGTELFLRGSF